MENTKGSVPSLLEIVIKKMVEIKMDAKALKPHLPALLIQEYNRCLQQAEEEAKRKAITIELANAIQSCADKFNMASITQRQRTNKDKLLSMAAQLVFIVNEIRKRIE